MTLWGPSFAPQFHKCPFKYCVTFLVQLLPQKLFISISLSSCSRLESLNSNLSELNFAYSTNFLATVSIPFFEFHIHFLVFSANLVVSTIKMHLNQLPDLCLLNILGHLKLKYQLQMTIVCSRWAQL